MNALQELYPLTDKSGVLTVDSRLIAKDIGVEHSNFYELVKKYQSDIEHTMGGIRFETGVPDKPTGNPPKICFLTEDQALFAGTLCRNTPTVIEFKRKLVTSFQNARRAAQQFTKELSRKDLALMIIQAEEELEKVKAVLIEQQPKVDAWQQFLDSEGFVDLTYVAQTCKTGRNTLYKKLRDAEVFYYKGMYNAVYQQYITAGYFDMRFVPNEKLGPIPVIKCTPKGAEWIYNKFYRKAA